MENFELIDQYLTGKLEGQDKVAFENKLTSDPDFKSEVDLQAQVVEGIKKARAAELKSMLNNVPVGSAPLLESVVFRIAASVVGGGALIAALYFYNANTNGSMGPIMSTSIEDSVPGKSLIDSSAQKEEVITPEETPQTDQNSPIAPEKKKEIKKNAEEKSGKPNIEVIDPSGDVSSQETEKIELNSGIPAIRAAQIEIETIDTDKKHSFHYQFEQQKLVLFGTFDKGLYEVIEINGETRSLFLYYKSNYHLLDPTQSKITPLESLTDTNLIRKLNQFRAQ